MGSGKTTVANAISKQYGIPVFSFATKVKELTHLLINTATVAQATRILLTYFDDYYKARMLEQDVLPFIINFLEDFKLLPVEKEKPRKLYQFTGNTLRFILSEDIWVDLLKPILDTTESWVIDDCRYPNEGLLRTNRYPDCRIFKLNLEDSTRIVRLMKLYPSFTHSWLTHNSELMVDKIENCIELDAGESIDNIVHSIVSEFIND